LEEGETRRRLRRLVCRHKIVQNFSKKAFLPAHAKGSFTATTAAATSHSQQVKEATTNLLFTGADKIRIGGGTTKQKKPFFQLELKGEPV
jgi:hypothetical protein